MASKKEPLPPVENEAPGAASLADRAQDASAKKGRMKGKFKPRPEDAAQPPAGGAEHFAAAPPAADEAGGAPPADNAAQSATPRRPAPAPAPELKPAARRPRALSASVVNAAKNRAQPPEEAGEAAGAKPRAPEAEAKPDGRGADTGKPARPARKAKAESARPQPPPPEEPAPAPPETPPGAPAPPSEAELAEARQRRTRRIFAVLFPACALLLVVALFQYIGTQQEYDRAEAEYDELARQAFPDSSDPAGLETEYLPVVEEEMLLPEEERPITLAEVMQRNEDCVAWIEIPDTQVNYPLVQGPDNDRYLNRTFLGNVNSAGAIFLDYRNNQDMSSLHSIIYGHNMKNGSMFGSLNNYVNDAAYIEAHPIIKVHNGSEVLNYRVVSARVGDKWDDAYRVDFAEAGALSAFAQAYGAPPGVTRLLTLSTCTNGPKEERVLVHAVYEEG